MNLKQYLKKGLILFSGISAAVMIPLSFYWNGLFQNLLLSSTGLHIDSRFTGGEIMNEFPDPYRDDYGAGSLSYPLREEYGTGAADFLTYRVYKPQTDAPWADFPHYWQLELVTSGSGDNFSNVIYRIYLDYKEGGFSEPLFARQELAGFDPASLWDAAVDIRPRENKALLYFEPADSETSTHPVLSAGMYLNEEKNTITLRLPLTGGLECVLDGRDTRHYVISSLYDQMDGFMPLKQKPSRRSPGGAVHSKTPRIFDIVCSLKGEQEEVLNPPPGKLAVLRPLTAGLSVQNMVEERSSGGEAGKTAEEWMRELEQAQTPLEKSLCLFNLGRLAEALEILTPWLETAEGKEKIEGLALAGAVNAALGGESPPLKAMTLVEKGYELINEALALAGDDGEERALVLIYRGNVSLNVPEEIFGKSLEGGRDLEEAAALYEKTELPGEGRDKFIVSLYRKAALCYRNGGYTEEARLCEIKADSY